MPDTTPDTPFPAGLNPPAPTSAYLAAAGHAFGYGLPAGAVTAGALIVTDAPNRIIALAAVLVYLLTAAAAERGFRRAPANDPGQTTPYTRRPAA